MIRGLVILLGVLAVLFGLYFFFLAFTLPLGLKDTDPQFARIYTQASYDALMAIGAWIFAGLCATSYASVRIRPIITTPPVVR